MRRFVRCALLAAALLIGGCVLFEDLESTRPFPGEEPPPTCVDCCEECPDSCVDGECVDPCAACADDEQCVDGDCRPLGCSPDDDPECCEDPDCAGEMKQCIEGEEVSRTETCPCEIEQRCVCPPDQDACVACEDPEVPCQCISGQRCPDGSLCNNGRCDDASGPCLAGEEATNCQPCDVERECPSDFACDAESRVCFPVECIEVEFGEACFYGCTDGLPDLCPGDRSCMGSRCHLGFCECPEGSECAPEGHCIDANQGAPIECQSDDTCDPGVCILGLCIGI